MKNNIRKCSLAPCSIIKPARLPQCISNPSFSFSSPSKRSGPLPHQINFGCLLRNSRASFPETKNNPEHIHLVATCGVYRLLPGLQARHRARYDMRPTHPAWQLASLDLVHFPPSSHCLWFVCVSMRDTPVLVASKRTTVSPTLSQSRIPHLKGPSC